MFEPDTTCVAALRSLTTFDSVAHFVLRHQDRLFPVGMPALTDLSIVEMTWNDRCPTYYCAPAGHISARNLPARGYPGWVGRMNLHYAGHERDLRHEFNALGLYLTAGFTGSRTGLAVFWSATLTMFAEEWVSLAAMQRLGGETGALA